MILNPEAQIREYVAKGWWGTDTYVDLFLQNAERTPEAVALADPPNRADLTAGAPVRLTYAEARQAIDQLASAFLVAGLHKDDVIMVQLGK